MRTCPSCDGKRGHYSRGRRVSKFVNCPTCAGFGNVVDEDGKGCGECWYADLNAMRCGNRKGAYYRLKIINNSVCDLWEDRDQGIAETQGTHTCKRCETPGQKVLILDLCPACAAAELSALRAKLGGA
jgi:hypothetical protein